MEYLFVTRHCRGEHDGDEDYSDIANGENLSTFTVAQYNPDGVFDYRYTFYNPDRLPFPEREFVVDRDELFARIGGHNIKYRPVDILTREDCNTIAGRTKLLEWEQSRPYLEQDYTNNTEIENRDFKVLSPTTRAFEFDIKTPKRVIRHNNFDETQVFTPQKTIEYILRVGIQTAPPNEVYNGLWTWGQELDFILRSAASQCTAFHPDLLFANIEGHDITTRDQFRTVVEKHATDIKFDIVNVTSSNKKDWETTTHSYTKQQVVDELLKTYDNCQHLIDCLFATYELYRTEQYSSIAELPMTAQRVAIRNFLTLFKQYNHRSGIYKAIRSILYKGAVEANTKRRLNIPDEVFNYAKKTFRIEPLTDPTPTPKQAETDVTVTDTKKGAIVSKEIRKQRDVQMSIFTPFLESRPPQLEGKSIGEVLPDIILTDIEKHKLFVNLIAAAQRNPSIDVREIAQRVAQCTQYSDLDDLTAIPVTINAREIIKAVFGKVSPANTEKFELAIRTLPNEPFVHYPLYIHKNKRTGVVTSQRVTSANVDEFRKKGYSPIGYLMPRFGWGGWKFQNKDKTKETDDKKEPVKRTTNFECIINVNALHYSAMADENGHLSNFDYYTPEYIEYVNSTDNDTMLYAYPTERLLFKAYDQHFKRGETIVGRGRKAAKERGEVLNKEDVAALRKMAQTININKQQFYTQVLECTYKTPDDMTNMQKKRIMTYIDNALRRMVEYGVLIKSYMSTADGKSWRVTFIDPQRPSF